MAGYVCDTHPLVWYLTGNTSLSPKATQVLTDADADAALVYVPAIVPAELLSMAASGKLPWPLFVDVLLRFEGGRGFRIVDLDLEVLTEMIRLTRMPHTERPVLELHDLSILATAMLLRVPIVTRDRELTRKTLAPVVW